METINFSDKNIEIIKSIIETDVQNIAEDISFFDQLNLNPKIFIDERIDLCKIFDMDFWSIVDINCSHYLLKQLQALYDGKKLNDFVATYKEPTFYESATDILKIIFRIKTKQIKK